LSGSDLVRFSEETPGLLTGVSEGSAVVTASLLGKSTEATLIIGKPEISSITVSIVDEKLRVLLRQQFSAEATYTDGSKETITELALWSSSNPGVIAVSSDEADRGVTTILKAGEAEISARFGEVVGSIKVQVPDIALTELRISPENPFACASKSTPLSVFGRYADGIELDMTSAVSFSVADSAVASVSVDAGSKGVATATTTGQTTITASLSTGLGDLSDSVTFLGVDGLSLVAPVGGEVLYSGVPSKVQWASCGEAAAGSIEVSVSTNSGNSYVVLGSIDEAAAEYNWTPSSNTESARVKVSRVGTQDSDESSSDFSVRSPFLTPGVVPRLSAGSPVA
jgi:hypothetical protein